VTISPSFYTITLPHTHPSSSYIPLFEHLQTRITLLYISIHYRTPLLEALHCPSFTRPASIQLHTISHLGLINSFNTHSTSSHSSTQSPWKAHTCNNSRNSMATFSTTTQTQAQRLVNMDNSHRIQRQSLTTNHRCPQWLLRTQCQLCMASHASGLHLLEVFSTTACQCTNLHSSRQHSHLSCHTSP
jgi:hypothetical protein